MLPFHLSKSLYFHQKPFVLTDRGLSAIMWSSSAHHTCLLYSRHLVLGYGVLGTYVHVSETGR